MLEMFYSRYKLLEILSQNEKLFKSNIGVKQIMKQLKSLRLLMLHDVILVNVWSLSLKMSQT